MLYLGASPTELGLVASVPLLAQVMSPFAAYLAALAGRTRDVLRPNWRGSGFHWR